MSKWNFNIDKPTTVENFESISMPEKIKKIREKRPKFENPKSIGLLETIFDPLEKQYYDLSDKGLKEGFDLNNNAFTSGISDAGKQMLAGIEGTGDSFKSAFDKIAEVTKLNKLKSSVDVLDKIKSQTGKVSDALEGAKNFIMPDALVSKLTSLKDLKMGPVDLTENTIFQSGKSGIDDIMGRAQGSGFFDQLSADSITIKGKLDALQGDINNQKLKQSNAPGMIKASDLTSPGRTPGLSTSSIKVVGLGDQLKKKMKEALDQIQAILNFIMIFISKRIKYGAEKVQSFFVHFRDNFNYVMITIANALTHNNASIDEVKVFSSETMKFTTVLFTSVFLYNWYYLIFHNESPEFRYTINVQESVFDRSRILYGIFGPSLRAVEMFDWILLEKIPMIKEYISSKPLLFFSLAIGFLFLVLGNFQMTMLNSFLKALTFSADQTILSVLTSIIALGYGLKFICYDAGMIGALWRSGSGIIFFIGGIFFLLLFIFYTLFIAAFAAPLGVLLVNAYIVIYSFFAIMIYEGSNMFTVINDIFKNVSGLTSAGEEAEQNAEAGVITRIGLFINKYIKFINMFLVELLIIMILLFGINTYTSQYGSINFDATTSTTKNSIASPVNSAFTHLFTWLIIFNTLLIVFIVAKMVGKYYKLTDPNQQQEQGEESETT
jgi:hypothetical protein